MRGCIAIDPLNSDVVCLSMGQRGVYRSTDGGATFMPSMAGIEGFNVRAIAITPGNSAQIFVGLETLNDAFVTKLAFNSGNGTYSLAYSTYLGSTAFDNGWAIAIDGSGNAYAGGETGSATFPATPGSLLTFFRSTDGYVEPVPEHSPHMWVDCCPDIGNKHNHLFLFDSGKSAPYNCSCYLRKC